MTIESSQTDNQRVQIFQALSDPTRIEIIRQFHQKKGEMSRAALNELFTLSSSTLSYHVKALKAAGLILYRKEGREYFARLNEAVFKDFLPGFLDTL